MFATVTTPRRLLLAAILSAVCFSFALAQAPEFIAVGQFSGALSEGSLPDGWKPLTFKDINRYTVYRLVADEDEMVVRAVSQGSASGMIKQVKIDPREYPMVNWRWKVGNVLQKGDVNTKEGDDYPARIYITFEYDSRRVGVLEKAKYEAIRLFYGEYPPLAAINYLWASNASVGTLVPNPYAGNVMMFVLQSGPELVNTWVEQQQNVYEDYKLAFQQDPPMISGVAIMTDTDNTQEAATAFFGDITFTRSFSD